MSWTIDTSHSNVQFAVTHMMISTVRGEFTVLGGTVNYDEDNPAATTVDVFIDADSINTREAKRDGHLRSPDFLNVEEYPRITFTSTSVEVIDENNAKLTGDLTIRDVTNPVTLDVNYVGKAKDPFMGRTSVGFHGIGEIKRSDWGLTWNQTLETGGVLVGDKVQISIDLELVEETEEEPAEAGA